MAKRGKTAKRTDPVSREFVAAVMAKLRVTTPRELATALKYDQTDKETQVGRWVRGDYAPSFHATIKLLGLAGWLKPEALRAYGQAEQTVEQGALEEALKRVETGAPRRVARSEQRDA